MNRSIGYFYLMIMVVMLSACGSDSSDAPDFDMKGLWVVTIVPGRARVIDITSQDAGRFSGSGGAYLVDGTVDGNRVSMSIYIPGSIRCVFHVQTHTEEFEFREGLIENVAPANGQYGEIHTTGHWHSICTVMDVQISAIKQG